MYQKAIVTFLDILGFSDLVKRADAETINKVLEAVEKSTSPVTQDDMFEKEVKKDERAEVVSFSDSIVRVRKFETVANREYPSGLIFQELISLVHAQGELIDFDVIIRGSVGCLNRLWKISRFLDPQISGFVARNILVQEDFSGAKTRAMNLG